MAYSEKNLRKGPWLDEEDEKLVAIVGVLGERYWDALAKQSGLRRSGKSCRLRWMNYLRPNLKHGRITEEEEHIILHLHKQWGNKWAKIARRLPGRTDNEIKNYWRSHLRKKTESQQESFGGAVNDTEQDLLLVKCKNTVTSSAEYTLEDNCMHAEDGVSGMSSSADLSSCKLEPCNVSTFVCDSPYESRVSDWISTCWLNDDEQISGLQHHKDCMGVYPCFCYLGSIVEESETLATVGDYWSSIWDMD